MNAPKRQSTELSKLQQVQQENWKSPASEASRTAESQRESAMATPSSEFLKLQQAQKLRRVDVYPAAGATQEQVAADAQLFFKTLSKFTSDMGSTLVIPQVRGKTFELHRLYCEVTRLGGLEKVTREKKWGDVAAAFDLPRTVTRPVYFLRMHYTNLLHHYEQVYYHGKQGPLVPPPDALPKPLTVLPDQELLQPDPECKTENHQDALLVPEKQAVLQPELAKQKNAEYASPKLVESLTPKHTSDHRVKPPESASQKRKKSAGTSAAVVGQTVIGSIDGKFEQGYFISVMIGSEKLHGVIYSVPEGEEFEEAELKPEPGTPRRARRKRKQNDSPDAIKTARSPYNFFVSEQRQKMIGIPRNQKSRLVGDMWNGLSEVDRLPYYILAKNDKERFEKEKLEQKQ